MSFSLNCQDEIRARRNQEAAAREWRRKETQLNLRKLEVEEKLKAARLEQVTHKEHLLSIVAGRERAEFERVLRYKHHNMYHILFAWLYTEF